MTNVYALKGRQAYVPTILSPEPINRFSHYDDIVHSYVTKETHEVTKFSRHLTIDNEAMADYGNFVEDALNQQARELRDSLIKHSKTIFLGDPILHRRGNVDILKDTTTYSIELDAAGPEITFWKEMFHTDPVYIEVPVEKVLTKEVIPDSIWVCLKRAWSLLWRRKG